MGMIVVIIVLICIFLYVLFHKDEEVQYTKDAFFNGILNEPNRTERHRRIAALREEQTTKMLQEVSDYLHNQK